MEWASMLVFCHSAQVLQCFFLHLKEARKYARSIDIPPSRSIASYLGGEGLNMLHNVTWVMCDPSSCLNQNQQLGMFAVLEVLQDSTSMRHVTGFKCGGRFIILAYFQELESYLWCIIILISEEFRLHLLHRLLGCVGDASGSILPYSSRND